MVLCWNIPLAPVVLHIGDQPYLLGTAVISYSICGHQIRGGQSSCFLSSFEFSIQWLYQGLKLFLFIIWWNMLLMFFFFFFMLDCYVYVLGMCQVWLVAWWSCDVKRNCSRPIRAVFSVLWLLPQCYRSHSLLEACITLRGTRSAFSLVSSLVTSPPVASCRSTICSPSLQAGCEPGRKPFFLILYFYKLHNSLGKKQARP